MRTDGATNRHDEANLLFVILRTRLKKNAIYGGDRVRPSVRPSVVDQRLNPFSDLSLNSVLE